jgi:CobQ-like glutamine amidotransferase family enzyme
MYSFSLAIMSISPILLKRKLVSSKGYELFGKYLIAPDGTKTEYLGVLDTWTESGQGRLTGNIVFECDFLKSELYDGKIIGFENHSGRTFLGPGAKPLGRVIKGFGNNGVDRYEGAIYKNVYCSYSHGSLLPKNPELADYLITLALKQKYNDFKELPPLDDELEKLAHDSMVNRILK